MASASSIASITDFDRLPVPGTVLAMDGTILAINAAAQKFLARPVAQALGRKAWDFAPGLEHAWEEYIEIARSQGQQSGTIVVATPEGPRTLEYIAVVRGSADGDLVLACGLDITQHEDDEAAARASASEDAERRLESLGQVAGGIAHDFNNQLVSVLAEASAARETPELGEGTREALRRIEAAASRMAQLTRQLLAYAGRGRLVSELIDPDELVGQTHEQLSRTVRPDADLVLRLGAGGAAIQADRGLLRQVIVNLVTNASDALGEASGRILVTTRVQSTAAGSSWVLEVVDEGAGMESYVADRIFEPFFTTKPDRHGLGLSAAHGIVRRLGGVIDVETHPGHGSRFRVQLPVIAGGQPERPRSASQSPTRPSLRGTHVLVADDEPSVRTTVRRLLERRGATVVTAADGAEAAARLREGPFALVLLDVMMPVATGYQLLPVARAAQPGAMVMLMSGYTEQTRGAGAEDEPDFFLEKPFTAKVLDAAIDELLDRRRDQL